MAVLHAKALLEDGTVTVRVGLELHGHGNIVTVDGMLERLIRLNTLTILHEDGRISASFDRRTRVPAELVAERIVSLLSDWDTSAVALVAHDLVPSGLSFVKHFHGAEDVDTWVKAALVQHDQPFLLRLSVQLQHNWRDVARCGDVDATLDSNGQNLWVQGRRNERDDQALSAYGCLYLSGL